MNAARDEHGPAGDGPGQAAGLPGLPGWRVIHSGTAESAATPAARAVMRTSDGEFRITAAHVGGKLSLTIEMLDPEPAEGESSGSRSGESSRGLRRIGSAEALAAAGPARPSGSGAAEAAAGGRDTPIEVLAADEHTERGDHSSRGADHEDDGGEDLSPTFRSVLSPTAVPRPRRADREDRDGRDGRDGRSSEAA